MREKRRSCKASHLWTGPKAAPHQRQDRRLRREAPDPAGTRTRASSQDRLLQKTAGEGVLRRVLRRRRMDSWPRQI